MYNHNHKTLLLENDFVIFFGLQVFVCSISDVDFPGKGHRQVTTGLISYLSEKYII